METEHLSAGECNIVSMFEEYVDATQGMVSEGRAGGQPLPFLAGSRLSASDPKLTNGPRFGEGLNGYLLLTCNRLLEQRF